MSQNKAMKKSLKERMEEASLNELMPGFDKDAGWAQLSGELHTDKRKPLFTWQRAAAILVIVAAGGLFNLLFLKSNKSGDQLAKEDTGTTQNWIADVTPAMPTQSSGNTDTQHETRTNTRPVNNELAKRAVAANNTPGKKQANPPLLQSGNRRTKEFVCNGTPCPLEICIIQTIYCKDQKPSAVATCNTLEPDQARQLHYKAPDGGSSPCKVTVDEIRIRRVTTGETIVLNAHSKPSTAQELFNCITGHEKCDLLAGIFEADCNNQQKSHSLKIDNNFGNLIMQ